jgi:hypothetical protein
MEGNRIVVGDSERVGYVAIVSEQIEPWFAGKDAPLGVPRGERLASEPFSIAAERTGARQARAERWREPGFEGQWLVFRLKLASHGVELALPVLEGRRSSTLFWLPLTWRAADQAPAPPPVDPAEKFGIRFEAISRGEQQRRPWTEGFLEAPGLRAEVPRDWYPAASLRSSDGFPIRFVEGSTAHGRLIRLAPDELPPLGEASDWAAVEWKGARVGAAYTRDDGSYLLVTREGYAFLFEAGTLEEEDRELWDRMVTSIRLMRSGPR